MQNEKPMLDTLAQNPNWRIKKKETRLVKNFTTTQNKFQFNSTTSRLPERKTSMLPESPFLETMAFFVCDECARPLSLYGENFIETYTNGTANILRCLCDLHADEMGVNG